MNYNIEIIDVNSEKYPDNLKRIANPPQKLYVIGITGTNGKTTISTLVYKYLRYNQIGATLIGTNGIYINDVREVNRNFHRKRRT